MSLYSTPSISILRGSFMPWERLMTMVYADRLMNRSRNASQISTSECLLKFYRDYSSLLKTRAAITVRMLNQMYSLRGLGLQPKKQGLGVLQICRSSTLRNFSFWVSIKLEPGSLYLTSISTEMGYTFFTFSRQVSSPSGKLFFSFFTSFFMVSHSIDTPISRLFTKQTVLLPAPLVDSMLTWKICMGTFLLASRMYMWRVLVKRQEGKVSFISGSSMETQGKMVFSRKTLKRYRRYQMSLQERYSARQQSPYLTGTMQKANFWYYLGGTCTRKSPILFRTCENYSSLPMKMYYRKLEQKNSLQGYCLMAQNCSWMEYSYYGLTRFSGLTGIISKFGN